VSRLRVEQRQIVDGQGDSGDNQREQADPETFQEFAEQSRRLAAADERNRLARELHSALGQRKSRVWTAKGSEEKTTAWEGRQAPCSCRQETNFCVKQEKL